MHCGLLGQKLGHSYSPQIHKALGSYTYSLFEKEPEELESFLHNGDFTGLNVTIPYKKTVIPYCNSLSPTAQQLGAVNTIVRSPDGSLIGHNTDYFGFTSMLTKTGLSVTGKKVLVLGSGGASATVVAVLQSLGADPVVISRNGPDNYQNLHRHLDASVIVNATPVGMYPNTQQCPIAPAQFPSLEGVLDLIYNPARTQLLQKAEQCGLITENGLWMLVAQAKESAQWFTGNTIPDSLIAQIHRKLRADMENIVLIGMPGCGKSTVGAILSGETDKQFIDADEVIVKIAGKSIPEIFEEVGEPGFRKLESQVLNDLGKRSACVIATGGGCVTVPDNYQALHQNSTIIWLQRDTAMLPTKGRPLSQKTNLQDMYAIREPLYRSFADYTVKNTDDPQNTVNSILKILREDRSK